MGLRALSDATAAARGRPPYADGAPYSELMALDRKKNALRDLNAVLRDVRSQESVNKRVIINTATRENARVMSRLRAAIGRWALRGSTHSRSLASADTYTAATAPLLVDHLIGVSEALRDDYKAGPLSSVETLIRGEVFGDYLDMAEHLLDQGYVDAAAVIVGGTLEAHMRQLCIKEGIPLLTAKGGPKSANDMNVELRKADVYQLPESKLVDAWLALRHPPAHGHRNSSSKDQISQMQVGVRDFIARVPA